MSSLLVLLGDAWSIEAKKAMHKRRLYFGFGGAF